MNRAASSEAEAQAPPLWRFVPLADYAVPQAPAAGAAAAAWSSLRQVFRRGDDDEGASPARQENELRALPELRLEHLVRAIDWSEVSKALDAADGAQADEAAAGGVRFVIGQPHCGHADIVAGWASRHGARLVEPPSHDEILAGDGRWRAGWPEPGHPWALPRLERCFLRHAGGLQLLRRLLEDVAGGGMGEGLIGCDSWAWAYLQRVWPLPQPAALTLQAFDGPGLSRLFAHLAAPEGRRQLLFRHARSGRETLAVPHRGGGASDEIEQLAAHCRGNVGTARAYWRHRLRAAPDAEADDDDAADDARPGAARDGEPGCEVVWVSADLSEPALPVETGEDAILVLHALLLHGGLADAALPDVLPLPRHLCAAIVLRLHGLGLLQRQQDCWHVSALGYALVRRWLRGRDFLTDDF